MRVMRSIVVFGAGYAAGMKIGDRPVVAARTTVTDLRSRASSLADTAGERARSAAEMVGSRVSQGTETIDVRQVREIMTAAPETIAPDASLREAARVMERNDVGAVIVVDEMQNIVGILTDRDITIRGVAEGKDPATTRVRDVQTGGAIATIEPSATVQDAVQLMREHNVRRIPVVEEGKPIGIVSLGDLDTAWHAVGVLADISKAPPDK